MSTFLPTSKLDWIDPIESDRNKYCSNSYKGCILEVDLECSKILHKLHNDCALDTDKIEIKKRCLSLKMHSN